MAGVTNMCVRVAEEALGRVDLFDGLVAVAIDEVKYKKGHRYLTVVCDHITGQVIWAAKGRSKATVGAFFDALGPRAAHLQFVTADGATWITDVVAERAPDAIVCLDSVPRRASAPRGAVSLEAGERPASLGCRSSLVKLRAA